MLTPSILPITLSLFSSGALPQDNDAQEAPSYQPEVAEASEEGQEAMAKFGLPDDFVVELVAAEPHTANPVCFYPANDGSIYICETFRLHNGVTDMRWHVERLEEDMACQTVEDRVAMHERWAGDNFIAEYGTEHERIKLLKDTDGDGVVDWSEVYADGFNDPADGIAAGLLEHNGDVYYACVPHLWRLRDLDGDGRADERESLSYGYGVRVTLLGHDLHGLRIGPDGWLYFSCGDRGFNVETEDGRLFYPDAGAVLRCRLDGSDLEIFHTGLRNPQELVFDEYGNLFTGDNNSDGGDKARWVQIIEGADTGWRSSYQWIFEPVARGPWNTEGLWKPHFDGQAAYLSPPIDNLANGPSGLAYYPGTGLSSSYQGSFFLCDFRGQSSSSGVHTFKVEPKGAGFKIKDLEQFVWHTLVTDVDFGPDGVIYFSDWVHGWNMTGKGRLYRTYQPRQIESPVVLEVKEILGQGVAERSLDELQNLLQHDDMRVRQMAQFELVNRGADGWKRMQQVLKAAENELACLHAIWGLGMAADEEESLLEYLHPFLRDPNARIRAQVARVLGDHRYTPAAARLVEALGDESAPVQLFAGIACGRLEDPRAVEPLFALAREAADRDLVLRHASIFGLQGCASDEQLIAASADENVHARLAAVVALRRRESPEVVNFLDDSSPLVVLEAARAIIDVPIESAFEALARLIDDRSIEDESLLRRILNANLRLGDDTSADALGSFAIDSERPERLRADAIMMLASWEEPAPRDYVISNWRPIDAREAGTAPRQVMRLADEINDLPDSMVGRWIELASVYPIPESNALLAGLVQDRDLDGELRVAALVAIEPLDSSLFERLLRGSLSDRNDKLRASALEALPRIDFSEAVPLFESVLENGGIEERRAVYSALGRVDDAEAQALLMLEFEKIGTQTLPAELRLDLIEAMATREPSSTREAAMKLRDARLAQDPILGKWRDSFFGGDLEQGRKIHEQDAALSCVRCHLTGDQANQGVGPDLSGVGQRLTRDQLVQAIVDPNARIAPGFEAVLLVLEDDELVAGRIVDETTEWLTLINSDGELIEVESAAVIERRPDLSAMPEGMGELLTPRQMRDLIEYLSSL
jgi:quinoprotein glucose dehydrogenase